MRDEKEERKKQARSNKQTRQSNTAHPRPMYTCMYTCRAYEPPKACAPDTCKHMLCLQSHRRRKLQVSTLVHPEHSVRQRVERVFRVVGNIQSRQSMLSLQTHTHTHTHTQEGDGGGGEKKYNRIRGSCLNVHMVLQRQYAHSAAAIPTDVPQYRNALLGNYKLHKVYIVCY